MNNQPRDLPESPFKALSRAEQQARWLEFRSRQLEYLPTDERSADTRAVPVPPAPKPAAPVPPAAPPPAPRPAPLPPELRPAPPPRHRELDKIKEKHQAAMRTAQTWQSAQP